MNTKLLGPFWFIPGALLLSLAWLLPNHTPPWLTFHSDAWTAMVLSVLGIRVACKRSISVTWHVLTLAVGLFCVVPWLQYALGLIPNFGTAWINSIYLLGFLFALQTGEAWERQSSGQTADFVFAAVLIAALVSTGLQFFQWSGLESMGLWTLGATGQSRFSANMAQPNQLASLLLLGLLGCSWGVHRGKLNAALAVVMACFLLMGVALTESRTAWVNLALLGMGAVVWRKKLPSVRHFRVVVGLGVYFAVCVTTLPWLASLADPGAALEYRPLVDHARLGAWKMLIDASLQRPLTGFGWGQLASANFLVIENYPGQPGLFTQSHNLVLDLILWNGYPLGSLAVAVVGWWVWKALSLVRNFSQIHLIAFVMVLGAHAMLEYPLQYAFFLLPFGLVVGALHSSLGFQTIFQSKSWIQIAVATTSVLVLAITVRDYFRVETSFYGLRFENRQIATDIPSTPPEVIALTQFRDHLLFARNVPRGNVAPHELGWMIDTVNTLPSAHIMYKLAANLALNHRPHESQKWLLRLCKTTPAPNCQSMKLAWDQQSLVNAGMAAVDWPGEFKQD